MKDLTREQKILCQSNGLNPYSIEVYLDYVNNYVSFKTMAVDYGISDDDMIHILDDCRGEYYAYCDLVATLNSLPN